MEHIAIMKKSWGLTPKILAGRKTIESRWSRNRCAPWGRIKPGEKVYFKDSGEPVSLKARVEKVLQFQDMNSRKVQEILEKYGQADGLENDRIPDFYKLFKDKKYCMLIFLKNPRKVEPFDIDKSGFGSMAAWICTESVDNIKK